MRTKRKRAKRTLSCDVEVDFSNFPDLNQEFQIYFRPLKDGERPLFLTLLWGSAHSGHGFRLKDQMDNSPIWDDFKEAELEAFLRMYEGNDFIFIEIKVFYLKPFCLKILKLRF